eukprot:735500-Prorocentrum_minimum.AAC.1
MQSSVLVYSRLCTALGSCWRTLEVECLRRGGLQGRQLARRHGGARHRLAEALEHRLRIGLHESRALTLVRRREADAWTNRTERGTNRTGRGGTNYYSRL